MQPNYRVTVWSKLGLRSEVLPDYHIQATSDFISIFEALDYMRRQAEVHGWRKFELVTLLPEDESLPAIPLRGNLEPANAA